MTQPDAFLTADASPAKPARMSSLWIAGAIVLGVVFLPALLAGVISLLVR